MTNNHFNVFRTFCALIAFSLIFMTTRCLAIPHATRAGSRTLQLKGDKNTYTLEPLSQQGSRSYVYQVVGGWGANKTPAIAKMFRPGENDADDISDETDFAKKARQWLADGTDSTEKEDWLILTDLMSPEVSGEQMYHFEDLIQKLRTKKECEEAINAAPGLVKTAAEEKFGQGIAIYDLSELLNIVFNLSMTKADLLDMGGATSPAQLLTYQTKAAYLAQAEAMVKSSISKNPRIQSLVAAKP